MATPFPYDVLRITSGDTVVDIADGTDFVLTRDGWSPRVATRRESVVGNQSPFNDVAEEMTVNIYGDTVADVLENVTTLVRLLDRSTQWARGENVPTVILEYLPKGSLATGSYKAEIRGATGTNNMLEVKPVYNIDLRLFTVQDVRLRFVRSGDWYMDGRLPDIVQNFAPDSSFESANPFAFWKWEQKGSIDGPTIETNPVNVFDGSQSIKIDAGGGVLVNDESALYGTFTGLVPGQSYTFTAWIKANGFLSSPHFMGLCQVTQFYQTSPPLISGATSGTLETSGDWVRLYWTADCPSNGAMRWQISNLVDNTDPVYVDAVTFGFADSDEWIPDNVPNFEAVVTATGNPNVLTVDFGANDQADEAVVELRLSPISSGTNAQRFWDDGYICYSTKTVRAEILASASLTNSGISNVSVTGAYLTGVRRFTPTTSATTFVGGVSTQFRVPPPEGVNRIAVFALMKGTTGTTWRFDTAAFTYAIGTEQGAITSDKTEPAIHTFLDTDEPEFVFLGILELNQGTIVSIVVTITPTGWNDGRVLDINYLALWGLDDHAAIVKLDRLDMNFVGSSENHILIVSPKVLQSPVPSATVSPNTFVSTYTPKAQGEFRLTTQSQKINVLPLLKKWDRWMYYNAADEATPTASTSFTLTAKRTLTYRIPR
jgi:hypothetical protein